MDAKILVDIWVAQGLAAQEVEGEEVRMEDVARDYLNELIGRNMVQVKGMKYDGRVRACQMHDLLRDLSIRKAKEEIDFEVLREGQNSSQQSLAKPRHRAVYFHEETSFIYSTNRNQHLRSLFVHCYGKCLRQYISSIPSSYWKSFELLRELHFDEGIIFEVLPEGIGELTGLRYLRMRYRGVIVRLPRSWAKLKNLVVLDLRGRKGDFYGVIIIDKVILKMETLHHLYVCVESCEVGLGNMRKLQTLHQFRVESCDDLWKIKGMSRVSKLGIDLSNTRETPSDLFFKCLSSLENLFHLTLISFNLWSMDLEGLISLHSLTRLKLRGRNFLFARTRPPVNSPSLYFPPNLLHLTLTEIWLEEDPMSILEKLPNLVYLKLSSMNSMKEIMVITSGGFPTLKVLHIHMLKYTCRMEINEESAMPELNQFIITHCPDLDIENVPERIKFAIVQPY